MLARDAAAKAMPFEAFQRAKLFNANQQNIEVDQWILHI
jgi:hypothetical protein